MLEYDLLGRQAAVHYPGSPLATYAYTYTRSDEVKTETSPRGHVSTFTYDQADRATERLVVDGEGEPVETVTYAYDPFDRVLRVENGTAIVTRTYDAYGNERTETLEVKDAAVGARTLTRTYDIGHGVDGTSYPSGATTLDLDLDGMGRWDELKENGSPAVDYKWTGPRLSEKTVKGGLASSYGYDATERMLDSIQRTSAGSPVFDWSLRWTERHEIEAEVDKLRRETENRYEFDGSGRLGQASYQVPKGGDVEEARRRVEYELDGVRNIERMVEKLAGEYAAEKEATIESGNAYGSFAGEAIEGDAEGNVTGIGEELTLEWTWDNRLARVTRDGATVRYGYDPLGRKVKREVENGPTRIFWYDGWELLEETDESGTVKWEGVTGQGVDEQLYYSPAMGGEYRVFHDRLGSVAGLVDETGAVVERYEYDPYGRMHRDGPEQVDHAKLAYPDLVLRFTGEIDYDSAMEPGRLVFLPVVEGEWEQSGDGRELRFTPDDTNWPATSVTLSIAKEIRAWTAIELQEGRELTWDAGDETDRILEDWVAPTVEYVVQDEDGTVRVRFSEAVDPATVGSGFELSDPVPSPMNQTTTVEEADPKTVRIEPSEEMTEEGLYTLELSPGTIKDVSGLHAAEADTWTWQHEPKPITIDDGFDTPEPPSLFENRFFFNGREYDPVSGLYDFRERWYSPEFGRFLSRDPLGYPEGPNQYAAFLSDPANNTDPTGTIAVVDNLAGGVVNVAVGKAIAWWTGAEYGMADAGVDFAVGFASSGLATVSKARNFSRLGRVALVGGGGAALGVGGALAHHSIQGGDLTLGSVAGATAGEIVGSAAGHLGGKLLGALWRRVGPYVDDRLGAGLRRMLGDVPCPVGNCFAAGTEVWTSEGPKSIEAIEPGDLVLAGSDETGEVEFREVVQTFRADNRPVLDLELVDIDGRTEKLRTTPDHPFWVRDRGWTPVIELAIGDELYSLHGGWLRIAGVTAVQASQRMYNMEVDGLHSYFVGTAGTWVHNCGRWTQAATPWKRRTHQRSDIEWEFVRPEGTNLAGQTNRAAAGRGYAPLRRNPTSGRWEDIVLHHANQDPRGSVVELWRSTHGKAPHRMGPDSYWRKARPDWARAWQNEQAAYWRWRSGRYNPAPTDRLRLPGDM